MSRRLLEHYKKRVALEKGLKPPPWGGRLSVALVYPNIYSHGMSNLGFQTVYHLLNSYEGTRCERFFLPDPLILEEHVRSGFELVSLETHRPLKDFDLVAFSISFENDIVHLPTIFDLVRFPFWSRSRGQDFPIVMCGGVYAFLNPEPLAEVIDIFAVGEAEAILPDLISDLFNAPNLSRPDLLKKLARIPGVYVPSLYQVDYDDQGLPSYLPSPCAPEKIVRQWQKKLDNWSVRTVITTPETEFKETILVELSRGCPRACRFCAAGYIYRPFREHSLEQLKKLPDSVPKAEKVGLVGSAVTDYSGLSELGRRLLAEGCDVSVSSVRIDAITPEQVDMLAASGHKTLALAPEAGSQRMRDVINKGIEERQILDAVEMIATGGVPNLKLYYMVGLPEEQFSDVEAIVRLTQSIRKVWGAVGRNRGRLGRLILSVNPFVPKPWTPFQWAPMEQRSRLEKKYHLLRKNLRPLANVELHLESLRNAELQGLLARGDRRMAGLLPLLSNGASAKSACRSVGLSIDNYLYRERNEQEIFPWEIIDQGFHRQYLWQEYKKGRRAERSSECIAGCRRCGLAC